MVLMSELNFSVINYVKNIIKLKISFKKLISKSKICKLLIRLKICVKCFKTFFMLFTVCECVQLLQIVMLYKIRISVVHQNIG